MSQFRPMNLRWSFLGWKNPVIHAVGISPDMGRHCDLGAITDPNHPDLRFLPEEPGKTRLCLQTEFLGPTTSWLLRGKYRFRLLVAASNRKPVAYLVEIHLTGLWSEGPDRDVPEWFYCKRSKGLVMDIARYCTTQPPQPQ